MPDQFGGDAAPNTSHTITAPQRQQSSNSNDDGAGESADNIGGPSVIEQIKLGLADAAKSFRIDMWLARHTPTTVLPKLNSLLDALEQEFADCVSYGQGVYGVGYCFGGKYILLLCSAMDDNVAAGQKDVSSQAEQGMVRKEARLKVGVLAHGTVDKDDFKSVDRPVGLVCVRGDALFPDEVREEGVKGIQEKGGKVECWVHEGVPHGEYIDNTVHSHACSSTNHGSRLCRRRRIRRSEDQGCAD